MFISDKFEREALHGDHDDNLQQLTLFSLSGFDDLDPSFLVTGEGIYGAFVLHCCCCLTGVTVDFQRKPHPLHGLGDGLQPEL